MAGHPILSGGPPATPGAAVHLLHLVGGGSVQVEVGRGATRLAEKVGAGEQDLPDEKVPTGSLALGDGGSAFYGWLLVIVLVLIVVAIAGAVEVFRRLT